MEDTQSNKNKTIEARVSTDTETPTESEVEPESAIDQIDIDLNPKPQTSSELRYRPASLDKVDRENDDSLSSRLNIDPCSDESSDKRSNRSVHFDDEVPVHEYDYPSANPSVQPSVNCLEPQSSNISARSLPNNGFFSGLRRTTLTLPTLSLSLVSISSIKERMSRRLTIKRSILSYCQSIWDGRLFKFNDLPEWMKDNEYITDMHRPQIKNILSCLRSIFSIHAETGNIWTHLIGALVFLGLIIYTLSRSSDDFVNPLPEKFVFTTFLACAFLCLSFSTAFHTLGCNTEETCIFCGRLDYTGIAILITGSFLPWVYYSFYCQPQIQYAYIGTIVTLGIICTCISLMKAFALPKYRHLRGILFLVFGMCGIAPCVHSTFFHGVEYSFSKGQMQNLILMGALYCIGVVFFITRFPESYWPGKFNLIFQSHQIFHVLVVSAALVQVYAITVLQDNRLIEGDTCPVETPLAASINTTQSSITV